jgi:hypothetical protein
MNQWPGEQPLYSSSCASRQIPSDSTGLEFAIETSAYSHRGWFEVLMSELQTADVLQHALAEKLASKNDP